MPSAPPTAPTAPVTPTAGPAAPPAAPPAPTVPATPQVRRGSLLGYVNEVEPLLEPTGGYPMIVRRTPTPPAPAPVAPPRRTPVVPPPVPATPPSTVDGPASAGAAARTVPGPRLARWWLLVAAAVIVLIVATLVLAMLNRQPTGPVSLPQLPAAVNTSAPAPAPTGPAPAPGDEASGGPSASASAPGGTDVSALPGGPLASPPPEESPSASPTGTPAPPPAALTARYETVANTGLLGLTGYRGQITVTNPGGRPANGWEIVLTLPGGETVTSASGATFQQVESTVTLWPDDTTSAVPAGASITFTFEVNGLLGGPPTACAVNAHPCD